MASALLRTSPGRGSAFRGVLSAAAPSSSSGEGLASSLTRSPIRRLQQSGAQAGDSSHHLKEKGRLNLGPRAAAPFALPRASNGEPTVETFGLNSNSYVCAVMVDLLNQSIKDVNRKVEKAHVVYASVQRLVEEKKPYNPFVQWLWQMGAVALFVFVEHKRSSDKNDN